MLNTALVLVPCNSYNQNMDRRQRNFIILFKDESCPKGKMSIIDQFNFNSIKTDIVEDFSMQNTSEYKTRNVTF